MKSVSQKFQRLSWGHKKRTTDSGWRRRPGWHPSAATLICNAILTMVVLMSGFAFAESDSARDPLPSGFVDAAQEIADLVLELRYFTTHNFVGEKIDGYLAERCVMTREAAEALGRVQEELRPFGLGLKVFDAYRPQRAVDHFVRWAGDLEDVAMKAEFYPKVEKARLFEEGYIAERSGHTRGSTVDVTLVSLIENEANRELDMGSAYDLFGPESWPSFTGLTAEQRSNRLLLRTLMTRQGFSPYEQEWWHFTLENEPYPETYFDFPIF